MHTRPDSLDPFFSSSPEGPPTVQDVLDLLHDLDQAHRGGLVEREEFQARKKELLTRIRRGCS
jgi:hypothetical protein